MLYKIVGEQPFQVLNDSFSVSPSESGYDLYISADGVNYTNFATVASGVTRQFTGMSNGNFYRLSGNTGTVTVNWSKECSGGGGSAAGVSSLDGQTGSLTLKTINNNQLLGSGDITIEGEVTEAELDAATAATYNAASAYTDSAIAAQEFKTINGSGITGSGNLVIESDESNYVIVNALSAVTSPYEGLRVYTKSGQTTEVWSGWSFDGSQVNEALVAKLYVNESEVWTIYRSSGNFFWDWENDNEIHTRTNGDYTCQYKADTGNGIFYLYVPDTSIYTVELYETVTSGETSSEIVASSWVAGSYIFNGSEFVPTSDQVWIIESMTQAEIASLVSKLLNASEAEKVGMHIYYAKTKCRYYTTETDKLKFGAHYIESSNGYEVMVNHIFWLKSDGTIETNTDALHPVAYSLYTDYDSNHSLSIMNGQFWSLGRAVNAEVADFRVYLTSGDTSISVSKAEYLEKTSEWGGTIVAFFEYGGNTIRAEWTYMENTATLVSWEIQPKVAAITQAAYDALVSGGTVDANTLYVII